MRGFVLHVGSARARRSACDAETVDLGSSMVSARGNGAAGRGRNALRRECMQEVAHVDGCNLPWGRASLRHGIACKKSGMSVAATPQ
jgi:hypothetical protein